MQKILINSQYKKVGIVIACFILNMLNAYFTATVPSLYTAVICNDLGFNRATFSVFSMIRSGLSFLLGLGMSQIITRIRLKPVVALGVISAAVSMLMMSASHTLGSFYVAGAIGSFGFTALNGATLTLIIRQSFDKGQNSLYGLVCASSGIMGVLFNPVLSEIVDRTSWQHGFRIVGYLIIGIGILAFALLCLFFHEKPIKPERETIQFGRQENAKSERLRLILVCILSAITGLCGATLFVNISPLIMSFGFSALFSTGLIASAAAFANFSAKIMMGRMFDKLHPKRLFILWDSVLIVGLLLCVVLSSIKSPMMAIVISVCIGSSCGIGVIGIPVWGFTCFSPEKQHQAIYLASAMGTIGSALGNTIFQIGYNEATNSYGASLLMEFVLALLFAILIGVLYANRNKLKFSKS